ncbi:ATPase family associated with various cellular activities (AAA) domain-containing protein [Phthorimaea operculella]|nr:ATPase family associated with various cellular activities (AAA) domain-containing protein [Phthorimaea operculella]
MVESTFSRSDVFQMAIRVCFVSAVTYFSIKWLVNQIDPTSKSRKKAEERAREQLRKAGLGGKQSLQLDKLTDHEMIIASQLVVPDEINVSWQDIAGLDSLIQELRETVILPIQKRELFADSRLTQPPKGVLLHGPPGCGKTLIAKATAKEANMSFINLDVSLLTDKWYGETQKLASAVFSLAVKLQPCIVFIDEIESFLRTRTQHDHEATAMMKTQFMSLWDGLITDPSCTVIIMGATNRPQDLDKAIQRRMPATFHVPMPSETQRERILQLILRAEPVAPDIDYTRLATQTEGFSGSDLQELCRQAAVYRVRDLAREEIARQNDVKSKNESDDEYVDAVRPITMEDLRTSLAKLRESKIQCGALAPTMRFRSILNAIWVGCRSVLQSFTCGCFIQPGSYYASLLRVISNLDGAHPSEGTPPPQAPKHL